MAPRRLAMNAVLFRWSEVDVVSSKVFWSSDDRPDSFRIDLICVYSFGSSFAGRWRPRDGDKSLDNIHSLLRSLLNSSPRRNTTIWPPRSPNGSTKQPRNERLSSTPFHKNGAYQIPSHNQRIHTNTSRPPTSSLLKNSPSQKRPPLVLSSQI